MDGEKLHRRIFSVVLSMMLVVSLFPVSAFGGEVDCNHSYNNGFCDFCYGYEAAVILTEDNIPEYELSDEYIGYYAINNAGQLYWLSDYVRSYNGEEPVNAVLTADIVDNENVLTESGELSANYEEFSRWVPIGYFVEGANDFSGYYEGTFDGNNHSISGLYFNDPTVDNVALFGYVRYESNIKNVTIKDSYFNGGDNVAGICAVMRHGSDYDPANPPGRTYIENCVNYATIIGTGTAAGICASPGIDATIGNCKNEGSIYVCDEDESSNTGLNAGGITGGLKNENIIENCINNGSVTVVDKGTVSGCAAGGICGSLSGSVIGCVNTASVSAPDSVGGICGTFKNSGLIKKCRNDGTITAENAAAGGIVGEFEFLGTKEVFLTDCYNTGSVNADTFVGGIVGQHGRYGVEGYEVMAIVSDVYNIGTVKGNLYVGAISGLLGDYGCIINSFYLLESAKKTDGTATTGYNWYGTAQIEMPIEDEVGYSLGVTDKQLASGEITYALNGCVSNDDVSWYQNIDRGDTVQPYPTFKGEKVYYIDNIYTNIPVEENHNHVYENGFCVHTDCSVVEPAVKITSDNYKGYGLSSRYIGYYGVSNAGQLYWFAKLFDLNSSPNIVLLNNVVVNTGVLDLNGNLIKGTYRDWNPIGLGGEKSYGGIFDGNGKTISGLYYLNNSKTRVGFFGSCKGAVIRDLKISDSYFKANFLAGGICAQADKTVIENCSSSACVEVTSDYAGGICGSASSTEITDCINKGNISTNIGLASTSNGNVGGICGYLSTTQISGCKNYGTVKGEVSLGGIVGYLYSKDNSITDCCNKGTVFASSVNAGGILGFTEGEVVIEKSHNEADVTGLRNVGGICGYSADVLYAHNCYNTGTISATESISGGICGYMSLTITDMPNCIETCYNKGDVTAPQYVGGVVGEIGDSADKISEYQLIKNCYYLESSAYDGNGDLKTGVGCRNTYPDIYDAPDMDFGIETVEKSQLTSGELACTLQSLQSSEMVWGQTSNRENSHPVLTSKEVHRVIKSDGVVGYSVSGFGDVDGNDGIDINDYQQLVNQVVSAPHQQSGSAQYDDFIKYDINGDGAIDVLDASLMNLVISGRKTIDIYDIGDIDFNGVAFEETDIKAIENAIKTPETLTTAEKRACDLNSDGVVDSSDLDIFHKEFGTQDCVDCNGITVVDYVWSKDLSTCTASSYCSICKNVKAIETVNTTSEITVIPTCTSSGKCIYTASFSDSSFGTKTYEVTVPVIGHTYNKINYVWASDYSTCKATSSCRYCSDIETEETVNSTHNVLLAATCFEEGYGEYVATFTDGIFAPQTHEYVIPATGHHFTDTEYTWASGYTSCVAKGVCQNCGNEIEEIATLSYSGNVITATFTSNGLTTQTVRTAGTVLNTYTAVYSYVSSQLAKGSTDIAVPLASDASAELITAIRRAICDNDSVADGSINLTITGVTEIPDNICTDETGVMQDGRAFGPDSFILLASGGGTETVPELKSVNLPDVTYIGEGAFSECCNLSSLYAPKAQTVGMYAFSETALTVIDLPEAVSVGVYAFANGYGEISYVNLPKATELGVGLFTNLPGSSNFVSGATVKLTAPGTEFTWLQTGEGSFLSDPELFTDDSLKNINLVLSSDKASQIKTSMLTKTSKWTFAYGNSTISYSFLTITTE